MRIKLIYTQHPCIVRTWSCNHWMCNIFFKLVFFLRAQFDGLEFGLLRYLFWYLEFFIMCWVWGLQKSLFPLLFGALKSSIVIHDNITFNNIFLHLKYCKTAQPWTWVFRVNFRTGKTWECCNFARQLSFLSLYPHFLVYWEILLYVEYVKNRDMGCTWL